jgi:hypothetical protein
MTSTVSSVSHNVQINWDWSEGVLDSDTTISKIARALVVPFMLIAAFEALVNAIKILAAIGKDIYIKLSCC